MNDESVIRRVDAAIKSALGAENVQLAKPITASEDFSVYALQDIPSLLMHFGVYSPEQVAASEKPGGPRLPSSHSPQFSPVPEPSIKSGIRITSASVLALMGKR